ncbi:MAG: 23S rRNA (pseudouridine(1915)-N(3))-methyltransferase RlmH [Methylococcaceae bacterium]
MIKLTLITIGTLPKGPFHSIGEVFHTRLKKFVILTTKILKSPDDILKSIPKGDTIIVLDAIGPKFTSESLAATFKTYEDQGIHITIILGGPHGLPESLKSTAHLRLSLSPLTTTHDLAHLFFLEQLYRICTINHGVTYHY